VHECRWTQTASGAAGQANVWLCPVPLHLVLFLGSGGGKCPVSSLAQYYCGLSSKHWLHARLHARRAAYYAALFTAATNRAISRESCGRAQGARSNLSHAAPEMIFRPRAAAQREILTRLTASQRPTRDRKRK